MEKGFEIPAPYFSFQLQLIQEIDALLDAC
jgi:hypothetical protein